MRKTNLLRAILLLLTLCCFQEKAFSQVVRCYTDEQHAIRMQSNPDLESREQFEQWMTEAKQEMAQQKIVGGVYYIPVVVHVIHNGEAVGSGTNVSFAAIQSQIDVLNEDFRRITGTNGYNTHPDGADTQIEFCLAQRRPDGSAFAAGEPGVNRINRSTAGFTAPPFSTTYIDNTIKTWTYNGGVPTATRGWSPDKYMNIWLCNISGGILGYAQFPESPLGGMGCGSTAAATDGVVFLYNSIGKSSVTGFPGPYNEGRTATHEIGHWLGLRHIWGDGGCTVDDFCNDTPEAADANYGCPAGTNSCTGAPDAGVDMIENYMDYTDDDCMNIFTKDQKARMRAVLEGSPMRVSLINSDACTPPNPNDASVTDIFKPGGDNCAGSIIPSVQLKNRGSSNLTSATISYKIDNGTATTFAWTGTLAPGAVVTVALPAFTAPLGTHSFKAYSTLPNGSADVATTYDTSSVSFVVSNGIMPNYSQDFESGTFPPDIKWTVENPNNDCFKWTAASGISSAGVFNNSIAQLPFYGNPNTGTGAALYENLVTPVFILPCNATNAKLDFKVAHRRRNTSTADVLIVEISTDCGSTWTSVFNQSGAALAQSATTSGGAYYPALAADWKSFSINIQSYVQATSRNIRFRFRGLCNNGNNIFIDDVLYSATVPGEVNVTANSTDVLDEGFYNYGQLAAGATQTATFTVQNTGTSNLVLTAPITVTGTGFTLGSSFGATTIAAGGSTTFTVNFNPLTAGTFTGNVSFATNDCDEATYNFILNGTAVNIPPVADFSASSTTICAGGTVTFTNLSTFATSYSWNFGAGASPTTSTATTPTVTFNTAGTYTIVLTATNSTSSDVETKTAYITVVSTTATALPMTEGFASTTFPPTGWTLINLGNAGTWTRSATVGILPTDNNSMMFNNFSINDPADDEMRIKPLSFTGLVSAQMTFDVSHRRYNATNLDGLEVLVSTNCGGTFTSVYSKSGATLATVTGTQTTAFVPTDLQWRSETIDLSAYIGQPNVIIAFRNLAGDGNNIYIDNINITGVAGVVAPVASFTSSATTICAGQTVTYTNTSTNSPTSYSWTFAGGTPSTSTAASPTVTYSTAGTYNVSMTATNSGGSNTVNQANYVTVNANVTPTFTFTNTYCSGAAIPAFPTTSTNGITGTWSPAISNTATTTYTFTPAAGQCATTATRTVTITPNATPTFAAVGPYCSGATFPALATTSTNAITGTWSPAINNTATTTYTFTPTAGQCATTTTLQITITPNVTPAFAAVGPYCSGATIPAFGTTSTNGITGTWSPAINNTTTTTYTFTPTAGQCATTATRTVTITPNATPTFTAVGPYCTGATIPALPTTSTNAITGTWSPAINNTATTTYTFTPTAGQCATTTTLQITITPNVTPAFAAVGPYCSGATIPAFGTTSTNGITGTWSPAINNTTTTTYTFTPAAGQCATAATRTVTITPNVTPTFAAVGPYCSGATIPALSATSTNAITGTWSPAINNTATTTYTFTPTAGQCATTTTLSITITPNVTPTFAAVGPYCSGATIPALSATSTNAITGTWSPAINNTATTTYTFTPTAGQCATTATMVITIDPNVAPAFAPVPTQCVNATPPVLGSASTNGITGTWSPASINTSAAGTFNFTFTPSAGQCAQPLTISVVVGPQSTPVFSQVPAFCANATAPVLPVNSNDGFTGTWSPSAVSNTTSGTYIFTPAAGQCATSASMTITVTPNVSPTFAAIAPFCSGTTAPALNTVSQNGISGSWSPSTVNNTASGTYTFMPAAGQCATTQTLNVVVNQLPTVSMSAIPDMCTYSSPLTLTQGLPAGGSYTGNGVSGGIFNPSVAGLGTSIITYSVTSADGCTGTATSQIVVTSCLGVSEKDELSIVLSPNPSDGKVTIVSKGSLIENAVVYDNAGRVVSRQNGSSEEMMIDLSNNAAGIYTIHVQTRAGSESIPVMIQK